MLAFWQRFHPAPPPSCGGGGGGGVQPKALKILCKGEEGYCLSVRDGSLVLAPGDSSDEHQHWFRDLRFGTAVQDEEGNPAFSLVNIGTGLAISHFRGPFHPVELVPYNPDYLDDAVMWTGCMSDRAFGCIRALTDKLGLAVASHGGGANLTVRFSSSDIDNQWRILPWSDEETGSGSITSRIVCKAKAASAATAGQVQDLCVTVSSGRVCLALPDPLDGCQHWVVDTRLGDVIKDWDGYPAFTLVNRLTGDAIRQPQRLVGTHTPVKLVPYNPNYLDMSLLWSVSSDMGHGFRYIRTIDDCGYRNLGAIPMEDHSQVQQGAEVMLSNWGEGDNLQWKIVPW